MNVTREYITNQAYSLFLNRSYEAVSMRELSKAVGFTKGTLYYHFRNKEEMFTAVVDRYLIVDELAPGDNTTLIQFIELCTDRARRIIFRTLSSEQTNFPINLLALFIDALRHYPDFSSKKNDFIFSEINKIKKILDQSISRGEIRDNLNTSVIAEMFFSIYAGIAINLIQGTLNRELAICQMKEQLLEFYKLIKA